MKSYGIRGAASIEGDSVDQVDAAVSKLMDEILKKNGLTEADLVSILFTCTNDIHSVFPATSARKFGLKNTPLICAVEMEVPGSLPLIIRALVTCQKEEKFIPTHIYLGRAKALRPDLSINES